MSIDLSTAFMIPVSIIVVIVLVIFNFIVLVIFSFTAILFFLCMGTFVMSIVELHRRRSAAAAGIWRQGGVGRTSRG